MIEYFKDHGYNLRKPNQSYIYPIRSGWKYKNTSCENTFYFSNNQHQVTLYYQPVIYNTDWSSVNGIGLYRNNSIPANTDDEKGAPYYTPDYLIKIENKNTAKYLIIDAKFSDSATVKKYDVKDLAFKYLFSVSPINATDIVMGMCIIYGKCTKHDQLKSAYDKQLSNSTIIPMADTLPMIEGVNTEYHYNNLDILFNKVLR